MFLKKWIEIDDQVFDDLEQGQRLDHKIVGGFKISDEFLTGQPNPSVYHQRI